MGKKKITYIANLRLPTEKAHGLQVMKMCEAFSDLGHEIELLVPFRFNKTKGDPFVFYNLDDSHKKFKIKKLFSLDLLPLEKIFGRLSFYVQVLSFGLAALIYGRGVDVDFIYCRDNFLLPLLLKTEKPVIYEAHVFPKKVTKKQVACWNKCHKIIVINSILKDFFINVGINKEKITIAHDGVDLRYFIKFSDDSKHKIRNIYSLPQDKKIILYTGHLYGWKGVDVLLEAARDLKDYLIIFVGGTEKDIKKFKERAKKINNILMVGFRPHAEIPLWLNAADVLVLPNTATEKISRLFTSPLKLFEYMASGRPIVASDLPSIKEVLNEKNAILVDPDNPDELAEGVRKSLNNPEKSKELAKRASTDVLKYTWKKRAEKINEQLQ